MSRPAERGEGRTGFIITLAVFGVVAFLAFKLVPVRIDGYQFRELLREEARYASVSRDDRAVKERIIEQAGEMKIPLDPENLSIRRTTNEVVITASYERPVDLKVTTYTYKFSAEQRAPLF